MPNAFPRPINSASGSRLATKSADSGRHRPILRAGKLIGRKIVIVATGARKMRGLSDECCCRSLEARAVLRFLEKFRWERAEVGLTEHSGHEPVSQVSILRPGVQEPQPRVFLTPVCPYT